MKARALRVVAALFAFGLAIATSAAFYPGGYYGHRRAAGFSFWNNFWCDLLGAVAINGADNRLGSALARTAFGCFAFALYHFWPVASQIAGRSDSRATHLGRFGSLALVVVAFVPSTYSELLHGVAVVISAGASLLALATLLVPLRARGEHTALLLAAATLGFAALCLGQYVYQGLLADRAATWLAGLQKLATLFLLAFMVHVHAQAVRGEVQAPSGALTE